MTLEEKRANGRKWARWSYTPKDPVEARKRLLERDLDLLNRIVQVIRGKLERKEKSKIDSLVAYHEKENRLHRPWEFRGQLEKAFRRVVKAKATFQDSELSRLEKAARNVLTKRDRTQIRLARTLRRRFQKAFRYGTKFSEWSQKLVGCSLLELQQHLERQWLPGMTWENYGFYGWHIDHIKPVVKFDLTDPAQVAACFHFSNMQPLWMKDNLTKSDS